MAEQQGSGFTALGKFISFLLIVGLIGVGVYVFMRGSEEEPAPETTPGATATDSPTATPPAVVAQPVPSPDAPQIASEMKTEVPRLAPPAPYQPKDNVVDIELSEYAGYAGLIVANGGLKPNDNSIFARKHGFKLNIKLSEEESWSALNSGKMAASATTADVLAVYGKKFNVVVPAQIGFSRGADGIVVRSDINRINQLKGKALATSQFTEADFFIRYLAQEAGLEVGMLNDSKTPPDPEKVNLFYCTDAFAAGDLFAEEIKAGREWLAGCVTWAPKTTEVADESDGKARVLTTNTNLLIIADILIVNKPFAEANPKIVAGLVDGLLEGNKMVRTNPDAHLDTILIAFNTGKDPVKDKDDLWDRTSTKEELAKVHFANLPENLAFFAGTIDSAGSFPGIYQSAVLAYGSDIIRDPVNSDRFVDLTHLKALEASGAYKDQTIAIAPVRTTAGQPTEENPLLSKDIRFFFEPNSAKLDMNNEQNLKNLADIKKLLTISPGSKILLRGHVDDAKKAEFQSKGGPAMVRQAALDAMQLSKERAQEIQRLLTEQQKVDPKRLDTLGRGWEEPVGTDSDKNRRVEVYWFTLE